MIQTGLLRKVDRLGRVTIPSDIGHPLGIKNNESTLDVWFENGMIALQLSEEGNQNAVCSRLVDNNGRYVIPASIRFRLGIFPGAIVEFFLDEKTILIKRLDEQCQLCSSSCDIIQITHGHICSKCAFEIAAALEEAEALKGADEEPLKKAN